MTPYELFIIIAFIIIVPLYITYLIQRRKEHSEDLTNDKIVLALKELGKRQPDFGEYLHKIGLL
jgi:uncharacterized membrane protein